MLIDMADFTFSNTTLNILITFFGNLNSLSLLLRINLANKFIFDLTIESKISSQIQKKSSNDPFFIN